MVAPRDLSIRTKFTISHLLIAFAILVAGSPVYIVRDYKLSRQNLIADLSSIAEITGLNCVSPLLFLDREAAELAPGAASGVTPTAASGVTPRGRPR